MGDVSVLFCTQTTASGIGSPVSASVTRPLMPECTWNTLELNI